MWLRSLYYTKKSFDTLKMDKRELARFQSRRLSQILKSCEKYPMYDNLDYDTDKEFSELPILNSEELRQRDNLNLSTDYERVTSGTRGTTTKVKFTEQAHDWLSALYVRSLYLHGYAFGTDIVQYEDDMKDQRTWLGKKFIPKKYIEPGTSIDKQIEALREFNPEVLSYFPQILVAICKKLKTLDNIRVNPELILTYGEPLTDSAREYIEETLDAPVRDNYASTEFGTIAWECPEGGYHIAEDSVYAEIVDKNQRKVSPGETGQLLLTGLANTANPLVRYDIGDLVVKDEGSCKCDTNFKKISKIRGRKKNVLINAEDDIIYPDELIDKLTTVEGILMYQIQVRDKDYVLRYVPNEQIGKKFEREVKEILQSKFSLKPLKIQQVKSIPKTDGGKLKIIEK